MLMIGAEAFERDIENLVINHFSLKRLRKEFREAKHTEIQYIIKQNDFLKLVLNWDGNMLTALEGNKKVER